jgi:hypothetical protein
MIYALVLALALGAPGAQPAPVAPGGAPHPAVMPQSAVHGGAAAADPMTLSRGNLPLLVAPQVQQTQLPPPCPPQKELPLNGFVTLPVARLGWCNPNDWRPLWYNFQGP